MYLALICAVWSSHGRAGGEEGNCSYLLPLSHRAGRSLVDQYVRTSIQTADMVAHRFGEWTVDRTGRKFGRWTHYGALQALPTLSQAPLMAACFQVSDFSRSCAHWQPKRWFGWAQICRVNFLRPSPDLINLWSRSANFRSFLGVSD